MKISVVINTYNEEQNIARVIKSVSWADEIVVCDMHSQDNTVALAKKLGAKVFYHKYVGFVEPARNFAISKASNEWILVLDADEEIPKTLSGILQGISNADYVEIPRKNIIFGKWMKASMWWPDYHIRFFKKGKVKWNDKIHSKPELTGEGLKLDLEEKNAIIHHHYTTITQFLTRMDRYTDIQAKEVHDSGYTFEWADLITKPFNEFLSRFFANKGFEAGIHGLALSLLQAFSFFVMYLKIWELESFRQKEISLNEIRRVVNTQGKDLDYWFKYENLSKDSLKSFLREVKNKIFKIDLKN